MKKNISFPPRSCRLCQNHNIKSPIKHHCPWEEDHNCLECTKVLYDRACVCNATRRYRNIYRENCCLKCTLHKQFTTHLDSQNCPFTSCLCFLCIFMDSKKKRQENNIPKKKFKVDTISQNTENNAFVENVKCDISGLSETVSPPEVALEFDISYLLDSSSQTNDDIEMILKQECSENQSAQFSFDDSFDDLQELIEQDFSFMDPENIFDNFEDSTIDSDFILGM